MNPFIPRLCATAALAATMFAAAGAAQAGVLFDNGSVGYAVGASLISDTLGFPAGVAADTFVLNQSSTVNQVIFNSWTDPGIKVTSVDWSIWDSAGVAVDSALASGFATVTSTHLTKNFYEYDINANSFAIPDLNLAAGTYWLELGQAKTPDVNEGVGWDQTVDGAQFYANDPSVKFPNAFTILGTVRPPIGDGGTPISPVNPAPGVPEPSAWALMLLGFGGLGAALRSARRREVLAV